MVDFTGGSVTYSADNSIAWAIFETHPQGLLVADASGQFNFANQAAGQILGVPRETLCTMSLFDPKWDVVGPDGLKLLWEDFPASIAIRTRQSVKQKRIGVRQALGSILWLDVSAGVLADGGVAVTFQDITEQHNVEVALASQRARSESMLRAAMDGICLLSRDGTIIEANDTAVRILGFDRTELIGMHIRDFDRGESPDETKARLRKVVEQGADIFATVHKRRDGTLYHAEISATFLQEEDRFVVFFRDVSEKQQAMALLKEERERFQAIVDSVDGIVWEGDALTFRFTFVSAKAVKLLGYPVEAWQEEGFWARHLHPEDREWAVQFCVSCTGRLQDHDFEYRFQKQDGDYIWLRDIVTVSPDATGHPLWLRGVMVDITATKLVEAELRESEHFLREAQEAGCIGTYSWDITSNHWKSSPTLDQIFGIGESFVRDLDTWQGLVAPDHREAMSAYIQELLQSRKPFDREYQILRPDGNLRWVHGRGSIYYDSKDRPIRLAGVIQDITDRRARELEHRTLQQQLARTQKLESLGSLAGGIAHDMNNVLGAILGMASVHEELAPPGSTLRTGMGTITKACTRGRELVQGLLSFARHGLAEQREVDLNTMIREQIALLERTTLQRVRLETCLAADLRPVLGDPAALAHALLNLCVNAVDAMPEGGSLCIRTQNGDGPWILIEITDSGVGMPQDVLEKAIDPFFTTKPQGKGTGLGLSLVFSSVKAHGGEFFLESTPGFGTCARIKLPAQLVPLPPTAEAGREPAVSAKALSVLVVDDDELMRETLGQLIKALGHQVRPVSGGLEALDLLRAGHEVDLVILDMNMPGMTGAQTLPGIRAIRPEVPVILATGRADQDAIDLCAHNPGVTLLPKPFSAKELRHALG